MNWVAIVIGAAGLLFFALSFAVRRMTRAQVEEWEKQKYVNEALTERLLKRLVRGSRVSDQDRALIVRLTREYLASRHEPVQPTQEEFEVFASSLLTGLGREKPALSDDPDRKYPRLEPGRAVEIMVLDGIHAGSYFCSIEQIDDVSVHVIFADGQTRRVPVLEKDKIAVRFADGNNLYELPAKVRHLDVKDARKFSLFPPDCLPQRLPNRYMGILTRDSDMPCTFHPAFASQGDAMAGRVFRLSVDEIVVSGAAPAPVAAGALTLKLPDHKVGASTVPIGDVTLYGTAGGAPAVFADTPGLWTLRVSFIPRAVHEEISFFAADQLRTKGPGYRR